MGLQAEVEKLETVQEPLRPFYKERGGKYFLEVDGMVAESALESLKDAMNKRLADATSKLEGFKGTLTRDQLLETVREATKLALSGGKDGDGKGNPDLERRIAALEAEKTKVERERDDAVGKSSRLQLTTQLQGAALSAGVRQTAIDNLVQIVSEHFELSGTGAAKTKVESSFGPDLDPKRFFEKVQTDPKFDYFWPQSTSGGADNGRGGGGSEGDNPWTHKGWNLTRQGEVLRQDRAKAERLAQSAGTKIGGPRPAAPAAK